MLVVGLTGSIGMGKTTAASYLRTLGVPVFDSDLAVHALYRGEAVPLVEAAFPGSVTGGEVDRAKLSATLQANPDGLATLEAIVHPLVRRAQWRFLSEARSGSAPFAVLDIPLLFETGADRQVDATIVVSAGPDIQKARVLARPGMTPEKLATLSMRQMPDEEKRLRATFVVNTGGPLEETHRRLDAIVADLRDRIGSAFARWRSQYNDI